MFENAEKEIILAQLHDIRDASIEMLLVLKEIVVILKEKESNSTKGGEGST